MLTGCRWHEEHDRQSAKNLKARVWEKTFKEGNGAMPVEKDTAGRQFEICPGCGRKKTPEEMSSDLLRRLKAFTPTGVSWGCAPTTVNEGMYPTSPK